MIVPPKFDDFATESLFLRDFRLAGLRSTSYACCVAIAGYFLIGIAEAAFNGWSTVAVFRRLVLILLLGFIVCMISVRPKILLQSFSAGFGSFVLLTYVSSVSATHLFRDDDPTFAVSPTALIGLWIIYGFVRLPIHVAMFIGLVGGLAALFGSRLTNMSDPAVRTIIYLLIGNALGVTSARSIEMRERQLFLQRRGLEEAQSELGRRSYVAEQASAEKTRLIAAVGHDLRQPMMAARLHLSVLIRRLRAGDADGVQRQADRVQESVKLLGETLEHLLLASRYEAGTEPISIRTTSLSRVLNRVRDLCEPQPPEGVPELIVRLPQRETNVTTDEQILLRALVNLVSNALKFPRRDPAVRSRVVVRATTTGGTCRVAVMDNGIGIADSDIASVWEPFFQVGNRERNREAGLGLGLYLVKQSLMKLPGHRISLTSCYGRGTCFLISLPGAGTSDEAEVSTTLASAAHCQNGSDEEGLRGMYVLIVEDDFEARDALQTQLAEWNVFYSSASNIEEALREHSSSDRRVDAILADFRLPGSRDGIVSIKHARSILAYSPYAILMSAEVGPNISLGPFPENVAFLQKPFDPHLLYELLFAALTSALDEERELPPTGPTT